MRRVLAMKNLYHKYWIEEPKKVHEYKIGTYHVSQIGNSHGDLEPAEHSGPCLRQGYFEYLDPTEFDDGTKGNFHMGNIIHKEIQRIMKINNPAIINELPLRMWIYDDMILSGSVDTVVFVKGGAHVIDIKSASRYTLPKGKYDKNITHFTQVYIYAHMLNRHVFGESIPIKTVSILYVNKHNLATFKQTEKFNEEKAQDIFNDFVERCAYLNTCLKEKEVPIAEPMKWCKYCRYREKCEELGND